MNVTMYQYFFNVNTEVKYYFKKISGVVAYHLSCLRCSIHFLKTKPNVRDSNL